MQPLVKAQPYVLHGSKDLVKKLANLQLSKHRKKYIISGDIVAFYPNIPLTKCLSIVRRWWIETIGLERTVEERALFLQSFITANKGLLIDFDDEHAEQIRGLAMGIACSPDIANLYGAHFENKVFDDENLKAKVPFFGRYLDDVLGIVYADTAEEALAIAGKIQYDDVEVEWAASEWHTPFLDLFVWLDPITGKLEHKPYRKPLHHRERIPWASHHPKDVKKGTYIGEMSRLATLSSRLEYYRDAIGDLRSLYIARGYPEALVRKWTLDNYGKRWENRLGDPIKREDVFVLKSHFNPAWSAFNVHELGQTITDSWLSSLDSFDELKRTVIEDLGRAGPSAPRAPKLRQTLLLDGAHRAPVLAAAGEANSQPAVPPAVAVSNTAGEPGDFVEGPGRRFPVYKHSLVEWEQAGSPRLDRALVHKPPLEVSLQRRRATEAAAEQSVASAHTVSIPPKPRALGGVTEGNLGTSSTSVNVPRQADVVIAVDEDDVSEANASFGQ